MLVDAFVRFDNGSSVVENVIGCFVYMRENFRSYDTFRLGFVWIRLPSKLSKKYIYKLCNSLTVWFIFLNHQVQRFQQKRIERI